MKMIDLLNKIANGENIKNIKYQNHIYEYYNGDYREKINGAYYSNWLFANEIIDLSNLNDEVEIIEEEKKIPEKLKIEQDTPTSNYYIRNENGTKCALTKHSKMIAETLNQVIDYLKSKGE